MIFLDDMYKDVLIDDRVKGTVFVDHEIRDEKDEYFESTDMFKAFFGINEEIEHFYLRLISQTKSSEFITQVTKTPEERFYILYTILKNNVTNKNLKEGVSGVTNQYHKYYQMYKSRDTNEIFIPEPAVPKKSRISKETMEDIGVDSKEKENISYDTSNHIIQRSDFPYEKIYLFEKYEFSNNVAYKFAKRSRYPYAELEDIHILKSIILGILEIDGSLTLHLDADRLEVIQKFISIDQNFTTLCDYLQNDNLNIENIYKVYFNLPSIHRHKNYTEYIDYFKEHLQYYDFIAEDYFVKKSENIHSTFLPRYKSPLLNETIFFLNDYRINIALPENELVEYIRKLKEDFNKSINNDYINALELMFGHKEEYYDEIANMLFIYDSVRVGFKYEHIEHSLNDFNTKNIHAKIDKKVPKDKKTIRKYFFYAKLLIEENYYRALITPAYGYDVDEIKNKIQQIKKSNS